MLKGSRGARGLSLPELLAAACAGLVVVAAAASVAGAQLAATRRLHLALEVDQQLRAGAELVARDLRRAAFWWRAGESGASAAANPYAQWQPTGLEATGLASGLELARAHPGRAEDDLLSPDEAHGLRLRAGALEMQLGRGNWQALTDPRRLRITRMSLQPVEEPACAAELAVRSVRIELHAQSVADPAVQRSWETWVRLRNEVAFPCPGASATVSGLGALGG